MRRDEDPPLASIGLPVFNEARYIDATLRCLRGQDYPRLEILVSDNASTDGTLQVCRRHADEDSRIRIRAQPRNLGALPNFERALEMASGKYFMWAGGHDQWSPNYISECVALLERTPRACIAFASSRWIGADDEVLAIESGWTDTRGMGPVGRLFTVLWGNMHPVIGLIHTDDLRACLPLHKMAGSDLVLLSQLALRGHFVHATQATWSRRDFRLEQHHDEKLARYGATTTGIVTSPVGRRFPLLELPFALLKVLLASPLPAIDKLLALAAYVPSLALRYRVGRRGQTDD